MIVRQDHQAVASLAACQVSLSFEQAVQELVINSLDAGATAVTVDLDPRDLTVKVGDNGAGIAPTDMDLLGERCCTSKQRGSSLGARGLALAAISAGSPLTVTSRGRGHFQTWEKAFRGRSGAEVGLAKQQRSRSGTEATLTCFLMHQPVRRSQLLQEKPQRNASAVRSAVLLTALPFLSTSFYVTDTTSRKVILSLTKGRSFESMLPELFGDAPYLVAPPQGPHSCCVVFAIAQPGFSESGSGKEHLYVNNRCVSCFRLSTLISNTYSQACAGLLSMAPRQRKAPPPTWVLLLECQRSAFNITSYEPYGPVIELVDEHGLLSPVKTALLAALESRKADCGGQQQQEVACQQTGLRQRNFRHDKALEYPVRKVASGGGSERQKACAESSFVSRLSGPALRGVGAAAIEKSGADTDSRGVKSSVALLRPSSLMSRATWPPVRPNVQLAATEQTGMQPSTSRAHSHQTALEAPVENPRTLQAFAYRSPLQESVTKLEGKAASTLSRFSFRVPKGGASKAGDSPGLRRSSASALARGVPSPSNTTHTHKESRASQLEEGAGQSISGPRAPGTSRLSRAAACISASPRRTGASMAKSDSQGLPQGERISLTDLLRGWNNPCIAYSKPILQLQELVQVPQALERQQVESAVVLHQLDRKFLMVKCGSILAVVDQHAADERVQLERLQHAVQIQRQKGDSLSQPTAPVDGRAERQAVVSELLSQPASIQLTSTELLAVASWGEVVESWGWGITADHQTGACMVSRAPVVLDRPLSLSDLRAFLWQMLDTCGTADTPQAVHRVLASVACRSAYMFGDTLTLDAAQKLLQQLAGAQQWFECAHGRPTAAPLVDLAVLLPALARLRCNSAHHSKPHMGLRRLRARLGRLVE